MYSTEQRNLESETLTKKIAENAKKERDRKILFANLRVAAQEAFNFDILLTAAVVKDALIHIETLVGGKLDDCEIRTSDRIFPDAPSNKLKHI